MKYTFSNQNHKFKDQKDVKHTVIKRNRNEAKF